jgi:hypothetical protein
LRPSVGRERATSVERVWFLERPARRLAAIGRAAWPQSSFKSIAGPPPFASRPFPICDREVHLTIHRSCGNPLLAIFKALSAHDPQAATDAIGRHIDRIYATTVEILADKPKPKKTA